MIYKLLILHENKLILNKFIIKKTNNIINLISVDIKTNIIRVPIYNKYHGINYVPLIFPLELIVINNMIFSPYIIYSSLNLNINNNLDFFYNIKKIIKEKYNYEFYEFSVLLTKKKLFFDIINNNYINNIKLLNLSNLEIEIIISNFWINLNIIKLCIFYILIKYKDLVVKNILFNYAYLLKNFKYNLLLNNLDINMTFQEFYYYNYNKNIKLNDIKINNYYYIIINNNESKIIKVLIKDINKNIITINNSQIINFDNYKWYIFSPNLNINYMNILYESYNNKDFTIEIIKKIFNIDNDNIDNILKYYEKESYLSNILLFNNLFNNKLDELEVIKNNSYTNLYIINLTEKYKNNSEKIIEILNILFNNYNYPLKYNRHELDNNFDHILYISFFNYKLYKNDNLNIPIKLKNLYNNFIKLFIELINSNFISITYNPKFYNDFLHKTILNILLLSSNNISCILFRKLLTDEKVNKIKEIIYTNLILIDICNKLNWQNLSKKLNYLHYFYKNKSYIYFQNKINKNIIPINFDTRIKKIIENPLEMYKYLKKEKDFIKWTKFNSDKIINLYDVKISILPNDFNFIGKILYLLFNITEQNLNESSYLNFINYCKLHLNLILDVNRINLKIKIFIPFLKININLGYLAKHLITNDEFLIFEDKKINSYSDNINIINNKYKSNDILDLELKLHLITKKYNKYKVKYINLKNNVNNITDTSINYILT